MPVSELHHPAIDAVLSTAASLLGTEVTYIGGLTEDTFTFERVHATTPWPEIAQGDHFPRADALCSAMLAGGPHHTADVPGSVYADLSSAVKAGITSYVGVAVRNGTGQVIATLCGIDRRSVEVDPKAVVVLRQLAEIVAAHLGPMATDGVVIRRSAEGGWQVTGDGLNGTEHELTSAMVLADLLASEVSPGARPRRSEGALDEVGQLRLSVTQLEHALAARVVVEQAIGVLTERQHHSPREAFERLRKVARARGRKVHDLAREVVLSATDPAVPLPPELAGRH